MIPESVERRARWVLDSVGARDAGIGDLPYSEEAWERVERGERPEGDEVAEAFFHLARVEEQDGPRDAHGRFAAASSVLDPLDPPVERLRARLGLPPPRPAGARFAVALTHDVDVPWRWTRPGLRRAASSLKASALGGRPGRALREARGLAAAPLHRLRGTDPNWCFERLLALEARHGARATYFVMAGHAHPADGPAPEVYERLRPRLVELLRAGGAEVGLHGSYLASGDPSLLAREKKSLEALAGPVAGQRYHYLRTDPGRNLAPLGELGFAYDSSVGFSDAAGFRAGIARPFRPWDAERDRPLGLVEVPLALMDVTLAEERYLGLSARAAWPRIDALLARGAELGAAFAVLWHTDRFDRWTAGGWDALYERLIARVGELGGVCLSAGELAAATMDTE